MSDRLVEPLVVFSPEIGRWLWALEEARRLTVRLVEGLDQRILDWEGLDGRENAIGSLLYHIGLIEMSWLYLDILVGPVPDFVEREFPYEDRDGEGRLSRVLGVPLQTHLDRLHWSRRIFLDTFAGMSVEEFRRPRRPADSTDAATPEWIIYHLVEHEAGHAFQISSLRARAHRFFEPNP